MFKWYCNNRQDNYKEITLHGTAEIEFILEKADI